MVRCVILALAAFCVSVSASAQDFGKGRWVDLTHAFNERSVYWPTAKMFTTGWCGGSVTLIRTGEEAVVAPSLSRATAVSS